MLSLIAAFSAFMSILLIIAGTAAGNAHLSVRARLAQVGQRMTATDEDLNLPLAERVWRPLLRAIAAPVTWVTPQRVSERVQQTIIQAGLAGHGPGRRSAIDAPTFMGLRVLATVGMGLLAIALIMMLAGDTMRAIFIGLGLAALAYLLPTQWLQGKAKRRKDAIRCDLPDAVDLLLLCQEAMGLDNALILVADHTRGPLHEELARVVHSGLQLTSRHDALRSLADRTGVEEVRSLVASIIQSDQMGTPLADVLNALAIDMRIQRRQRAETIAREAPIKMIFPLVLLILPPLFIVILGPSVPQILRSIAPGIHL